MRSFWFLFLFLLLATCCEGAGNNTDDTEVPAGSSREGLDPPRWRAWIASAEAEVDANLNAMQAAERSAGAATTNAEKTKMEAALVRAQDRLNDSRNRLASLVSSYAQICAVDGARSAPHHPHTADSEDKSSKKKSDPSLSKFLKRKLPEPKDGWRDQSGKLHQSHNDLSSFLNFIFWILWQLHDVASRSEGDDEVDEDSKVPLLRQASQEDLEQSSDVTPKSLLQVALNEVHEYGHTLYLRHTYNNKVAEAFRGDDVYSADRQVPTSDRVTAALKRVDKSGANTKQPTAQRWTSPWGRWGWPCSRRAVPELRFSSSLDVSPRPPCSASASFWWCTPEVLRLLGQSLCT